jgi:hypothetical protein
MLSGAIKNWPGLFATVLNPGGWIELVEFEVWAHLSNDSMNWAPDIQKWKSRLYEVANKIGRTMDVAVHLEEWVLNAGFTGVV